VVAELRRKTIDKKEHVLIRNWEVVGLTPHNTVVIQKDDGSVVDTQEGPAQWGTDGLSRHERGIVNRGVTASGNDKRKPSGATMKVR
jgi:hypothetical protein